MVRDLGDICSVFLVSSLLWSDQRGWGVFVPLSWTHCPSLCQGSSPAGGCLVALSCDYRIMAENPKFSIGLNEAQLGIVAPFW